ncbi:hypothetical protein KUV62_19425 [Salipiger bermudensis]|uniref:hypothetical protein n=1 Tax=Salipiger bermudensis TaxID=344736 RepID=UPI001C993613|nr:hypothetical protein [Salipiger bermudensis]MBY6006102.1 hypothetical protein [Salipiger bermudensis]
MLAKKPVGRNAAAFKYDLLTVMGAYALAQEKGQQRLVLRLMTLITARYNWGRDELAVGQREIARLWQVDERTVKRQMAKLRAMGWLVVKRQGARGRVSEYALGIERILEDSRDRWADVGPDLAHRLSGTEEAPEKIVPLPVKGRVAAPDLSDGSEWTLAKALLHAEDPGLYGAWIAALERGGRAGGRLHLKAPSRFHASYVATHLAGRVLSACQSVDGGIDEVIVDS